MRDCLVIIKNDKTVEISCPDQYAGEHNATRLVITLNDELTADDISYYTLCFNPGAGNANPCNVKLSSDAITESSAYGYADNGIIYFVLPEALTPFSTLDVQVEAHVADENETVTKTVKSPVFPIKFEKSVSGEDCIIPEDGFEIIEEMRKALATLNTSSPEIESNTQARHTHTNKNTLDLFSCQAVDTGFESDASSTELKWQGKSVAFADGTTAMISGVEEVEKDGKLYLRLSLSQGGVIYNKLPDYIDIPVSSVKDVEETVSPDITLNGSELDFGVTNASENKFIPMQKLNASTDNTDTLLPNVFYSFGEAEALTLNFTEGEADKVNEYVFSFISGATATVLTLPSSVKWVNELTVEANKQYEISIVDNIALWCAVDYTAEVTTE